MGGGVALGCRVAIQQKSNDILIRIICGQFRLKTNINKPEITRLPVKIVSKILELGGV